MLKPVRKLRDHFLRDLINRINDLETAVRVVVDSPSYRHEDSAGFNGQSGRKRIFGELLAKHDFAYFIETGTYLGDTAGYMAKTSGRPVVTCELNPALHALAKKRLKDIPSIALHNTDSRTFLETLGRDPEIAGKECFFYLDAHWGKDLPLRNEISIVATRWEKFVIMIDDFQVPCDAGYVHDSYGTLENIGFPRLRSRFGLAAYFPAMPSREEPARAAGCAVLARDRGPAGPLDNISSLKRYGP